MNTQESGRATITGLSTVPRHAMATPIQYLDKAMTRLRDLGLVPEKTEEAPIVALLNRVSDLDNDKVVAIARTLSQASLFNQVVREQVASMSLGERYTKITEGFNSIRDDAKTMVKQVEDGRIDTFERLANVWQKSTRGDIAGRFDKVKKVYLDVEQDELRRSGPAPPGAPPPPTTPRARHTRTARAARSTRRDWPACRPLPAPPDGTKARRRPRRRRAKVMRAPSSCDQVCSGGRRTRPTGRAASRHSAHTSAAASSDASPSPQPRHDPVHVVRPEAVAQQRRSADPAADRSASATHCRSSVTLHRRAARTIRPQSGRERAGGTGRRPSSSGGSHGSSANDDARHDREDVGDGGERRSAWGGTRRTRPRGRRPARAAAPTPTSRPHQRTRPPARRGVGEPAAAPRRRRPSASGRRRTRRRTRPLARRTDGRSASAAIATSHPTAAARPPAPAGCSRCHLRPSREHVASGQAWSGQAAACTALKSCLPAPTGTSGRQGNGRSENVVPRPGSDSTPSRPPISLDAPASDRQPEPRARRARRRPPAGTARTPPRVPRADADAGVGDVEPVTSSPPPSPARDAERDAAGVGELHRVADEVDQHLPQLPLVADAGGRQLVRRDVEVERSPFCRHRDGEQRDDLAQQRRQRERPRRQRRRGRPRSWRGRARRRSGRAGAGRCARTVRHRVAVARRQVGVGAEQLRVPEDRVHRRADLVAHVGQERRLRPVRGRRRRPRRGGARPPPAAAPRSPPRVRPSARARRPPARRGPGAASPRPACAR